MNDNLTGEMEERSGRSKEEERMYKSWVAFSVTEEIEVLHLASHGQ